LRKLIFPPYFSTFPPCFRQIHLLFTYFTCISFPPYFDHDAFMHHQCTYWTPLAPTPAQNATRQDIIRLGKSRQFQFKALPSWMFFSAWSTVRLPLRRRIWLDNDKGVHDPSLWGNDAFPSVSDFPLFPKIFQTLWEIFPISPFPKEISISIRQNFWWLFLVIDSKFLISLYFRSFSTFPPIWGKLLFPPTFSNFSPAPWFRKIYVFYIPYAFFVSPYFDHDAFMHHAMHVLDAPVYIH